MASKTWSKAGRLAALTLLVVLTCAAPALAANNDPRPASAAETSVRVAMVLGFGVIALVGALAYLWANDRKYFDLARRSLNKLGDIPAAQSIPSIDAGRAEAEGEAPAPSPVVGPAVLAVGDIQSYSVKVDDPAATVAWAADPADGLAISPTNGPVVNVTANKVGTYTVSATVTAAAGATTNAASVTVVQAVRGALGAIPFVGAGYGTVVVAIVLIATAGVLGILSILDKEAIATLFGAIVALFVRGPLSGGIGGAGGGGGGSGGTTS
jgi:hypothetical protein